MKKGLVWLGVTALAAGLIGGCRQEAGLRPGDTPQEGSREEQRVSAEDITTFTVGFDPKLAPYGFCDENGEYMGFDLDLAAEVCARNGWELIKRPIDRDNRDRELSSGAVDCIWNGFAKNGREDKYTWSEPYMESSQVIVAALGSGIEAKEDLAGRAVAVWKDSSVSAALNDEEKEENIALRDSFAQLIEYEDYTAALTDLEQGAADAVIIDVNAARYWIAGEKEDEFLILEGEENVIAREQYAVGFLLGNEDLRDIVQATLDEMVKDGTLLKLARQWGAAESVRIGRQ